MQKELSEKKKEFLNLKHNSPPKGDNKVERIFKNIEKKTENMRKRKKTGKVSFIRTEMQDRKQ